jgi:hypothetical protein
MYRVQNALKNALETALAPAPCSLPQRCRFSPAVEQVVVATGAPTASSSFPAAGARMAGSALLPVPCASATADHRHGRKIHGT